MQRVQWAQVWYLQWLGILTFGNSAPNLQAMTSTQSLPAPVFECVQIGSTRCLALIFRIPVTCKAGSGSRLEGMLLHKFVSAS
jgi:hypothetical protein